MKTENFELYDSFPEGFWYVESRRDLIKRIMDRIYCKNNRLKILDVGCGTGFNYDALSRFGKVTCIDNNKSALRSCRLRGIEDLRDCNAEDLSGFEDFSFDLVVAIELAEHLPDDERFFEEAYKKLKVGGRLLITVPAHRLLWSVDDELAKHKRRYSKNDIEEKLKKWFYLSYIGYRYAFLLLPAIFVFILQRLLRKRGKMRNSLSFTPYSVNWALKRVMGVENWMISKGLRIPFGVGIIAIAEKKKRTYNHK